MPAKHFSDNHIAAQQRNSLFSSCTSIYLANQNMGVQWWHFALHCVRLGMLLFMGQINCCAFGNYCTSMHASVCVTAHGVALLQPQLQLSGIQFPSVPFWYFGDSLPLSHLTSPLREERLSRGVNEPNSSNYDDVKDLNLKSAQCNTTI